MILTRRDPSRVNREKRLDALWQKVVKTRDNFTCQRCGSRGPPASRDPTAPIFFGPANHRISRSPGAPARSTISGDAL